MGRLLGWMMTFGEVAQNTLPQITFQLKKLGWINCLIGFKCKNKTNVTINFSNSDSVDIANIYLVLHEFQ